MSLSRTGWLGPAAALLLALTPTPAPAGWFGLRNDTKTPILVQTGTMINNKLSPGRPHVLYPGEVAWDCSMKPYSRVIAIYDPRNPAHPLLQKTMPAGPGDVFLSVKSSGPGQLMMTPASLPANARRR